MNTEWIINNYRETTTILKEKNEQLRTILSDDEWKTLNTTITHVRDYLLAVNEKGKPSQAVVVAKMLMDFVNKTIVKDEELINVILNSHRTLQQSLFGLFKKIIFAWSEIDERHCDNRNRLSIQQSKALAQFMEENDMGRGMPSI